MLKIYKTTSQVTIYIHLSQNIATQIRAQLPKYAKIKSKKTINKKIKKTKILRKNPIFQKKNHGILPQGV